MPSVGPEIPSHLAKRKRSIDEAEDPKSPPRKVLAATAPTVGPTLPPSKNPDELDVDDSSEDDYGPSLGPSKPTTKAASPPSKRVLGPAPPAAVGPSLPPSKNPDELDIESDSEDDGYGPAAPATKPASAAAQPPKRVLGPAPPPASLSEMPSHPANEDSDSSDSDYGPSLPPAPGSAAEASYLMQRQTEEQESRQAAAQPAKPQRDDWMLVPPSDSDWTSRVDPTKLKNRKFASGKGAKAPAEKSGISAIWTETPEQKRQRLADEVLGRSDPSLNSHPSSSKSHTNSKEEQETERRIREYNEKNRGKSLLDVRRDAQEKGRLEKEEEDDPSKRGFDREKDMALGGRMGHVKKKEMLSRAADFGSRFQRGKYL
ncbi:hypothetical protein BDZ45DRAFT_668780 [Acephala macrosclerotiorum]|nr:hypothetical protein BDZ45DRAFT_668780 [Acephala macrosclerotiorum]